tara:strand:- start:36 stop:215 length:180 start_codon:yes stop_codon:yes gene_type:complete
VKTISGDRSQTHLPILGLTDLRKKYKAIPAKQQSNTTEVVKASFGYGTTFSQRTSIAHG